MLSVLLDTNILLDMFLEDRPESEAAAQLIDLVDQGFLKCSLCASSLKDIYYISRKYQSDEVVRDFIQACMDLFTVVSLDEAKCRMALQSPEPDFEDALIRESAEATKCDIIATRDAKAFAYAKSRPLTATEIVRMVQGA